VTVRTPPGLHKPEEPDVLVIEKKKRRRSPRRRRMAILIAAPILAAAVLVATRPWGSATTPLVSPERSFTLAWAVEHRSDVFTSGTQTYVILLGVSPDKPPFAVVVPPNTTVDLPGGGPSTFGEATTSPGLLVAASQATFDRRVDHYLLSTETDVLALVDRLGGITVQVQEGFRSGGETLGPGATTLYGADVLAYLEQPALEQALSGASGGEVGVVEVDETISRWQDVLWGLFSASGEADRWEGSVGESDAADPAALLARGAGALVTELPTAPGEDERLAPDVQAIAQMVDNSFPETGGELVRLVVLNGNGRPGQGLDIGVALAPHGFQVVSAQNAASFRVRVTAIIASSDAFLSKAEEVRDLLGVGRVYVGPQPTGIADITIVAGRDFTSE
jgi:hypothetical protein